MAWLERAVGLAMRRLPKVWDAGDQSTGDYGGQYRPALTPRQTEDLIRAALPALLDGLCPEEPSEEEATAAELAIQKQRHIPRGLAPIGLRAANRARRARIAKEMEE